MWVCPPLGQFAEGSGYQKYARSAVHSVGARARTALRLMILDTSSHCLSSTSLNAYQGSHSYMPAMPANEPGAHLQKGT